MDFSKIINNIELGLIKKSSIHGYGLFAHKKIKKNTVLGYLDGQLVDWDLYEDVLKDHPILEELFIEWNAITEKTLLVRPFRTKYSFINHSRIPNIKIEKNPLKIIAINDINEFEELLLDYREEPLRKEYIETHGKKYL